MFKAFGIGFMLIALALAIVPRFTDCQSQGQTSELRSGETIPMKCHWSGLAELGVAVPMYIVGSVMMTTRRRHTLSLLSVLGVVLGALAIAFPTAIIGVCEGRTMLCATLMRPAAVCLGGTAIGLSGIVLVVSRTAKGLTRASFLASSTLIQKTAVERGT